MYMYMIYIIEKAAGLQVLNHLANNNVMRETQSAYKARQSTETALIKIFDDIL